MSSLKEVAMTALTKPRVHGRRARKTAEFRVYYAPLFIICLVAAVVGRLLPWRWRPFEGAPGDRRSILEEARSATISAVPFAFMG